MEHEIRKTDDGGVALVDPTTGRHATTRDGNGFQQVGEHFESEKVAREHADRAGLTVRSRQGDGKKSGGAAKAARKSGARKR